jgi:uncharacterized protein YjbI with pentapeptide repeats
MTDNAFIQEFPGRIAADGNANLDWQKQHPGEFLDCSGVKFPPYDHLNGRDFSNMILRKADFTAVHLSGASFEGCDLSEAIFQDAVLHGAIFTNSKLIQANFKNARLTEAKLDGARIDRTNFTNANLAGATISETNLSSSIFSLSNLHAINFTDGTNFTNGQLDGAHFGNTGLISANFSGSNLTGGVFTHCPLSGASFDDANLSSAELLQSNCDRATFRRANLERANFTQSTFRESIFETSRFHETILTRTDFYRAKGLNKSIGLITAKAKEGDGPKSLEDISLPWFDERVGWEQIRWVGRLPLFAASYSAIILIPFLFYLLDIFNRRVDQLRLTMEAVGNQESAFSKTAKAILPHLHSEPIPALSMWLFLSTICLGLAATIFAAGCPPRIKEFSREQWRDQFGHSIIHYIPLSWQHRGWRALCVVLYAVGGSGVLVITLIKLWNVLLFIYRNEQF